MKQSGNNTIREFFEGVAYGIDAGGGSGLSVTGGFRRGYVKDEDTGHGRWTYRELDMSVGVSMTPYISLQGAKTATDDYYNLNTDLYSLWNKGKNTNCNCLE